MFALEPANMHITNYDLQITELSCKEPFQIALGTSTICKGVLIKLYTNEGIIGLGEAVPSPRIVGDTTGSIIYAISRYIFPSIHGKDPAAIADIHAKMDQAIHGNTSAKAAIDMALYDILGQMHKEPLHHTLGGGIDRIATDYTIGIKPAQGAAIQARQLVKKGFTAIKIKVGADLKGDIQRVKAVRKAVGPNISIRIDANQGWTVKEAQQALMYLEDMELELVEQPVPAWDLNGMAYLRQHSNIPIVADESVHSPKDAERAIQMEACDIINIKLMKCGGIYHAKQIAAIAEASGKACMIGGMIGESRISVGAAAAFAASTPVVKYADLDADLLLKDDLVAKGGISFKEGYRILPKKPGLGIEKLKEEYLSPSPLA